ncbi:MAG: winged helix-turn-helix domain-containing protein [Pseudomonadota bacterium]|nr:winged helix-turn-helix domain-containing protein [Pseudomonadota bacterium]
MQSLRLGDFSVDPEAGRMIGPAGVEQLDPKVMQVLVLLAKHALDVVPRHELLSQVWPGVVVGDDVVSRCIYQLRRHLRRAGGDERYAALVETLPKRGYRLNCESRPSATMQTSTTHVAAPPPPYAPLQSRWRLAAGIAILLIIPTLAFWHLWRADFFWQNPLADARYTRVTDFEGVVPGVAISRDGNLLAFLASRAGRLDAWISSSGTGEFRNVTQGRIPGIDNPVRSLRFTPDGSQLAMWTRMVDAAGVESIHTWAVRSTGGRAHPFLEDVAEVDWSPDGRRMVYHPAAPGDPLFVTDANQTTGRQIHIAPSGVHCHFPVWSPDGRSIYFVQGRPPDDMDIWRIAAEGGEPERITFHASRVSYPVFLDKATMVYLATALDGSGPWLHGMNIERRVAHRIGTGREPYTSLAASAGGRRLLATNAAPRTSLWRVPVMAGVADEADAQRIPLPPTGGRSPRLGPGYVVFVSPGDGRIIRKLTTANNQLAQLWRGKQERLVGGPAIDPISERIAFSVAAGERTRLQVMNADGTGLRTIAANLRVKGAPAWSPDGRSILVAAEQGQVPRLFKVPTDGARPAPFAADYSRDASWSPDGRFVIFNGADVGPTFPVKALTAEGRPRALPDLMLPRGARRLVFMPGGNALIVLKGAAYDRNFWLIDLQTGQGRQLTDLDPGFAIGDFDVSADGRDIVFDRLRDESDVVQIDLASR